MQADPLADVAAEAEGVVVVEDPLEAEGVEVLLRDLDEAGLDLDELRLAAKLVEHLLELGEVLAGVAHVELAERLDVLDGGALGPLDAHLLEERLPVLVGRGLGVLVPAGVVAGAEAVAHGLDLVGRGGDALDERLGHVVLAREDLGGGHVLVHHHDDGAADDELVVHGVADELQRLVEGDVVRGDGGDRGEAVGVLGGLVLVAGGGEVVGLFGGVVGGGGQLLPRAEVEVEAAALGREVGVVVVLRRLDEELHRVHDRGRRVELDLRQADLLHALDDLLLGGALGVVAGRGLHRLGGAFAEGDGVGRVDRAPRLVDVGDHPVARGDALLLEHLVAAGDDRLPQANRLGVVLVVDEDGLHFLERLVHVADRKVVGAAPQEAADVLAGELVVGVVAAVVVRRGRRGIRGGRDDGAFGLPALHQAAGLRVAAVDRLLQVLERLLVLAERALLLRRAEERLARALHALLAQVLVRGAVAQQLLGGGVVALGVEVLLLLHAGAGGINLAPSLEVALHTAVGLGGDDVVEELVHFGVGGFGLGGGLISG